MELTKTLLRNSLKDCGYSDDKILDIVLTRDYTNRDTTPEINMFAVKIRSDYISDSTVCTMETWASAFGYRLNYWIVKCEGWSNLNADTNKTKYYIEITYKFRRIGK